MCTVIASDDVDAISDLFPKPKLQREEGGFSKIGYKLLR